MNRHAKRYCIAEGCRNTDSNSDYTFFGLPNNLEHAERRRQWLTALGREDLLEKRGYQPVCAAHFDSSSLIVTTRLTPTAVPLQIEPSQHIESIWSNILISSETPSTSTQTQDEGKVRITKKYVVQTDKEDLKEQQSQTSKSFTDRKRKLLSEQTESKSKQRRLSEEYAKIKNELDANNRALTESDTEDEIEKRLKKLIEWQNKIKNKYKGNRYDAEYEVFALNLHYSSPHAYRCLQTVLKLPSKSTLYRLKMNIPPTLDDRALNSLALKLKSLPDDAKYCTICVDEITLKKKLYYDIKSDELIGFHNINGKSSPEIASNAFVIMLQGIYVKWKQPIAYALLATAKHYKEIDTWMTEVLTKLSAIGIQVKAIISDQRSNFDKFAKEVKKVTIEKPYFMFRNDKIYYVFDVPRLVKCVRDNLFTSDFIYDGKLISWKYIVQLYEDQKDRNLRLIPKITEAHIHPNKFQKRRVQLAVQVLSRTVSIALHTYIDLGKMSEEARPTAEFIETMNNLFDILNSSKIKSDNKFQTAFTLSKDQEAVLNASKEMFSLIKVINRQTCEHNTGHIKSFLNFQISMQSIIMLHDDLQKDGRKYLLTRRLNQNNLEDFFDFVRQQSGSCSEPTPIQFRRAFSKLFLCTMLKNAPSTTCEMDLSDVLQRAEDIEKIKLTDDERERMDLTSQQSSISLSGETDYRIDLPDQNALTYLSGYLFYKCLGKHSCSDVEKISNAIPNQANLFSQYKAYNKRSSFYGSLKMPPQTFIDYITDLENAFVQNFEKCIQYKPGRNLLALFKIIPPKTPCSCFPVDYLLKLFARFRIFATIRFNNRSFKDDKNELKKYLKVSHL